MISTVAVAALSVALGFSALLGTCWLLSGVDRASLKGVALMSLCGAVWTAIAVGSVYVLESGWTPLVAGGFAFGYFLVFPILFIVCALLVRLSLMKPPFMG